MKDFRSVTAGGVAGVIAGRAVMVGKPDFLRNEKATGLEPFEASVVELQDEGKTAMFVAVDGKPAGILAVADPIKSTTAEAIAELHALGLKLVMLTRDNRRTATAVARTLGLDAVEADIGPAGEVDQITRLRAEGEHLAMAGDGINDAPALSQAEVGIAMGTGTDVAMQSAGVTLVRGDLRGMPRPSVSAAPLCGTNAKTCSSPSSTTRWVFLWQPACSIHSSACSSARSLLASR